MNLPSMPVRCECRGERSNHRTFHSSCFPFQPIFSTIDTLSWKYNQTIFHWSLPWRAFKKFMETLYCEKMPYVVALIAHTQLDIFSFYFPKDFLKAPCCKSKQNWNILIEEHVFYGKWPIRSKRNAPSPGGDPLLSFSSPPGQFLHFGLSLEATAQKVPDIAIGWQNPHSWNLR